MAQASAAFILNFFYMIYLTNLFESPFLHTNKRNKAKNQSNKKKSLRSAATGEIWLMS